MKPKFKEGDKVFAKVRGYPYWPARVQGLADDSSKPKYNVYFYGSGETAVIKNGDICDFVTNKHKYGKNKKSKVFIEALSEIAAELTNSDISRLKTIEKKLNHKNEGTPDSPISLVQQDLKNTANLCRQATTVDAIPGPSTRSHPSFLQKQFKIETKLIDLTISLVNCFQPDHRDIPKALNVMDEIFTLQLTPVMLLKLPTSFHAIRRIKKFSPPPVEETPETAELLDSSGQEVREKASKVYNKFKGLFLDCPEDISFHEHFSNSYKLFKDKYKHVTQAQFVRITQFP